MTNNELEQRAYLDEIYEFRKDKLSELEIDNIDIILERLVEWSKTFEYYGNLDDEAFAEGFSSIAIEMSSKSSYDDDKIDAMIDAIWSALIVLDRLV